MSVSKNNNPVNQTLTLSPPSNLSVKSNTLNWVTTTNDNEEIVGNILNISGYTSYFFKNMPKLVHDKLKQKCIKLTKYAKFHSGQWRFEKKKTSLAKL